MPPQMILDISAHAGLPRAPCPVPRAGDTDRGFARTFLSVVSSLDSAGGAVASLDATAVVSVMVGLVGLVGLRVLLCCGLWLSRSGLEL